MSLIAIEILYGLCVLGLLLATRRRRRSVTLVTLARITATLALADALVMSSRSWFSGVESNTDLLGVTLGIVGTLFALVVGFVVVVVWQSFTEAEQVATREANALADLERSSRGFPVRLRRQVQSAARTYARLVITEEWKAMESGGSSERAHAALVELWQVYTMMGKPDLDHPIYAHSMSLLSDLDDSRRQRLLLATKKIPTVLWVHMAGNAIAVVLLAMMFLSNVSIEDRLIMLSMIGTIALVMFLIGELACVFSGDLRVHCHAFSHVIANMQVLEE
ncbi:hypothetical protein ACIQUM_36990 [Amycolatopsis azurea]|uniref:bestrophin-like domain n=1 Tax=Amycolatopsis azurea TaxID=36819 RepID=UPI00381A7785